MPTDSTGLHMTKSAAEMLVLRQSMDRPWLLVTWRVVAVALDLVSFALLLPVLSVLCIGYACGSMSYVCISRYL